MENSWSAMFHVILSWLGPSQEFQGSNVFPIGPAQTVRVSATKKAGTPRHVQVEGMETACLASGQAFGLEAPIHSATSAPIAPRLHPASHTLCNSCDKTQLTSAGQQLALPLLKDP